MIKELELLIPLLNNAGESAFWLIIYHFSVKLICTLIGWAVFIYFLHSSKQLCEKAMEGNND